MERVFRLTADLACIDERDTLPAGSLVLEPRQVGSDSIGTDYRPPRSSRQETIGSCGGRWRDASIRLSGCLNGGPEVGSRENSGCDPSPPSP